MLTAFLRAFKTPDLRRKLLFSLFIMAVFRLGSFVPSPGVDYSAVRTCVKSAETNGGLALVNLFSGGALLQLSIFALGIMPYITASIIIQLLTVVIPRFETLKQEGQTGTAKLTQYTRYLTMGLAILQSTTLVAVARTTGGLFTSCTADLVPNEAWYTIVIMVITLTAGTGMIMWLGELITEHGVGNGMSLLIFTSIASSFPGSIWSIKTQNDAGGHGLETMLAVVAMGIVVMALVIFVEQSQRRVPVQYAKRMVGRRTFGGTTTYIPLKVNMAGVIPVIFASSLLYLPVLLAQFQRNSTAGWVVWIDRNLVKGDHPVYMISYFLLIVFFTYFYVAITFNPDEVAENMKKYGGFIPGIRAGRPTAQYLSYILDRITLPGALYLGVISMIPLVALVVLNANTSRFPFGGTSILIIVGVGLETVKQIEAQLQQRHYEGFLK